MEDDTAMVSGTIQAPPNSAVTVNGRLATVTMDGRFFVNGLGLVAGGNGLTLTVTTPDGETASQNVSMTSNGPGLFRVTASPSEGIAPLEVAFRVENPGNTPFGSIEFDVNGDGIKDYTAYSLETANPIFPIGEGYSVAKVTVKSAEGAVLHTSRHGLHAYSAVQKYLLMKGVYTGMVDRLRAGNNAGALNHFMGHARSVYQDVFNKLGTDLPTFAAQLGNITTINMADETAEIIVVRDTPAGSRAFMLYLLRGQDGIWRIESM